MDLTKLVMLAFGLLIFFAFYPKINYPLITVVFLVPLLILGYVLWKKTTKISNRYHIISSKNINNYTNTAANSRTAIESCQSQDVGLEFHDKREQINLSVETLKQIEWYSFELFCKIYYENIGYTVSKTKAGADGGTDLILYQANSASPYALVQCKARGYKDIGVNYVRELLGVMTSEKVAKGILITNACFTNAAIEFSNRNAIEAIDLYKLSYYVNELEAGKRLKLVRFLERTDYTTPTCPNCEVKLVERIAKSGKAMGQSFWGCKNYPRCRYIMQMNNGGLTTR
jgi:restriction system protein